MAAIARIDGVLPSARRASTAAPTLSIVAFACIAVSPRPVLLRYCHKTRYRIALAFRPIAPDRFDAPRRAACAGTDARWATWPTARPRPFSGCAAPIGRPDPGLGVRLRSPGRRRRHLAASEEVRPLASSFRLACLWKSGVFVWRDQQSDVETASVARRRKVVFLGESHANRSFQHLRGRRSQRGAPRPDSAPRLH